MFRPVRALALVVLVLIALPAPGSAATLPCADPVEDPAMGLACPVEGGFLLRAPDGSAILTHGPDAVPPPRAPWLLPDPGVACVSEEEAHFHVVYALPKGVTPDQALVAYHATYPFLLHGVLQANAVLYANAMQHGVEMRLPFLCDDAGLPRFDVHVLDTRAQQAHFGTIVSEVQARGIFAENKKVLVFYDGTAPCGGCGGQATIPGGDAPGPQNWNNKGWWSYALVYIDNYGLPALWAIDEVILHEMTHTMGGVQLSAPNTSGGWHCNDGWDIMCYSDGGSSSWYSTHCQPFGYTFLGVAQPYDCGNDDYFHPSPPAGSYLATHWNVGAEYNRFVVRG